jgi:hypothetical protein
MRRVEKTEIMEDLKEGLYRMFRKNFLVQVSFHTHSGVFSSAFEQSGNEHYLCEDEICPSSF